MNIENLALHNGLIVWACVAGFIAGACLSAGSIRVICEYIIRHFNYTKYPIPAHVDAELRSLRTQLGFYRDRCHDLIDERVQHINERKRMRDELTELQRELRPAVLDSPLSPGEISMLRSYQAG